MRCFSGIFIEYTILCIAGEYDTLNLETETGFQSFRLYYFSGVIAMRLLEERILRDGKVRDGGVLKVDSFLNHQMDIPLFCKLAEAFYQLFQHESVNKILTVEASGIGLACITAQAFSCPVIFAKKSRTKNISGDVYTARAESFTHGGVYDIMVAKAFLTPADRVLIIDDFLARGAALNGLAALVRDAGAALVGAGIAIEKSFQHGGDKLRKSGMRIESLARIKSMEDGRITFC
jgi:xanthine phosphoribosyltransferase